MSEAVRRWRSDEIDFIRRNKRKNTQAKFNMGHQLKVTKARKRGSSSQAFRTLFSFDFFPYDPKP